MNKIILPVVIGAGLLAWYFLGKKTFARASKILFRGIKFTGTGLKRKLQLNFGIQNPTNNRSTINSITGSVSVNGKEIANFSNFTPIQIKPNQETNLPLTASLSQGIISLLLTKGWLKGGVRYSIVGNMNVDNIVVPFDFKSKLG